MTVDQLDTLPATLTVPEAGTLLGLGRDASYAAANRGELPVLRIGRRLLVPTGRLRALLVGPPHVATGTAAGNWPEGTVAHE
ncbi:helix-turn-helix domain-containing protein [Nocardioides euryhalodurans]|nr:helix-turn-helix domain-containing protein [Nocardioides euryhalodurans]